MTPDLFGPRTRKAPRVMMHVIDAGAGEESKAVHFRCRRCGFDEGWTTMTEGLAMAKRGRPCPKCNGGEA